MKFFKTLLLTTITVFSLSSTWAQTSGDDEKLSLNSGTIDNQFEYVIRRSNSWQDYKTVKKTWLYALKAHTIDSLKAVHKDLKDTQAIVDTQAKEIEDLKANLSNTKVELDNTIAEKDSIKLFGMPMTKPNYSMVLWSIVGVLSALLLFFIYKYRNSNAVTKQAKKSLAETEEEFEEHRRVALEREQKVRRQLQDEINKQKNA
ncbi:tRNA (guanine-N1)-methyltransferase [Psychroserpens algicola]|uniref:tRNA (Guanine-N1)-methyltransferase n=1 Tax=Psychroserpens algicola TaxID=1719034 RepID=A0ABT0H9P3_9FLAO|nr:tRNA (guanine-N1)-methyltransferase [Psychroserpens algicola]MCK8481082.1 tRNA (guanine-N1)-methyltransferase [Psychroserpens algicola]